MQVFLKTINCLLDSSTNECSIAVKPRVAVKSVQRTTNIHITIHATVSDRAKPVPISKLDPAVQYLE